MQKYYRHATASELRGYAQERISTIKRKSRENQLPKTQHSQTDVLEDKFKAYVDDIRDKQAHLEVNYRENDELAQIIKHRKQIIDCSLSNYGKLRSKTQADQFKTQEQGVGRVHSELQFHTAYFREEGPIAQKPKKKKKKKKKNVVSCKTSIKKQSITIGNKYKQLIRDIKERIRARSKEMHKSKLPTQKTIEEILILRVKKQRKGREELKLLILG